VLFPGEECRADDIWYSFARDKGRARECGDDEGDELRRASGALVVNGGVLIVCWQLLTATLFLVLWNRVECRLK
jgi:hypothetical protein